MDAKVATKLEMTLKKSIREADQDFKTLQSLLEGVSSDLNGAKINEAKIDKAKKALIGFLERHKSITTVPSKALEALSPEIQDEVMRIDRIYALLLRHLQDLKSADKLTSKKPKKPDDYTILIKYVRKTQASIPSAPKGVGTLLKAVEKGVQGPAPIPGFHYLPLAIILWMILDMLRKKLR